MKPDQPDAEDSDLIVGQEACIGCGVCSVNDPETYQITLSGFGEFQASRRGDAAPRLESTFAEVCPFASAGPDEDELAKARFPDSTPHPKIGRYLDCYAGAVSEGRFRERGSSGGMGSWITSRLLQEGLVDGVIHVRESVDAHCEMKFAYVISRTVEEVQSGAKSRYYPVEMSKVLREVLDSPGRYALVGVPCFIKAAQRLAKVQPVLADRLRYYVAIFCGHLKSTAFADAIAWEAGVLPDNVRSIDFRHKMADRPASKYGVRIECRDGKEVVRPMQGLVTQDWGIGLFKYPACDLCDDVTGETADVAVGDAWLPEYVEDSLGTNVVVVRNPELQQLLGRGIQEGKLALEPLHADLVAKSQAGGLRHRRDGLAYRLLLRARKGQWNPKKRVAPAEDHLTAKQKQVFELRSRITHECRAVFREAVDASDFAKLKTWLSPIKARYRRLSRDSFVRRVARRLVTLLSRWLYKGD